MRRGGQVDREQSPPRLDLGTLFDAHAATVYGYAARRVGRDLAEDVTSEVFAAAVRSAATFDPERGTPIAWLMGIATNVLARHWRTEHRHLETLEQVGSDPLTTAKVPAFDGAVIDAVHARAVASVLAEMPAADRDTLTLFAWADLSYDEIAAALDVPVGTVRSRIARARERVRDRLGDKSWEVEGDGHD